MLIYNFWRKNSKGDLTLLQFQIQRKLTAAIHRFPSVIRLHHVISDKQAGTLGGHNISAAIPAVAGPRNEWPRALAARLPWPRAWPLCPSPGAGPGPPARSALGRGAAPPVPRPSLAPSFVQLLFHRCCFGVKAASCRRRRVHGEGLEAGDDGRGNRAVKVRRQSTWFG